MHFCRNALVDKDEETIKQKLLAVLSRDTTQSFS